MPPQYVKPYVKRGKNDAADAKPLCEAMSRQTMRFVPVKSADQQAALMIVGMRDRLIRNRTQLANAIRGYAIITLAGDQVLRTTLVVGATSLLQQVRNGRGRHGSAWLLELLKRKQPKLMAVALANKIARIAWKLMVSGDSYQANAALCGRSYAV